MAATYKLYAAEVDRETVEKAEKERFSRVTPGYMLLYRRTKPRGIPCVEVKGADLKRLTESDKLWLADCIAAMLGEAAREKRQTTEQRVNELLDAWEEELRRTQAELDKEAQGENEGDAEPDN